MRFFRILKFIALPALLWLGGCEVKNYYGYGPAPGGYAVGWFGDPAWYPTPPRVMPVRRQVCGPMYTRSDGTWAANCHFEYW